ncbi:MAG: tetratricopeptide repeat protein [Nibricoccus sp.]
MNPIAQPFVATRRIFGPLAWVAVLLLGTVSGRLLAEEESRTNSTPAKEEYRLPEDPNQLLRIDGEMRAYFAARVRKNGSVETRLDEIEEAILSDKHLAFRYESTGVYDVREAFRRRRGNCITYSMLVVAVCREFKIPAQFNEVTIRPRWDRSGNVVLLCRHINVRVDTYENSYELDLKLRSDMTASRISARVIDDRSVFAGAYSSVGVYDFADGSHESAMRMLEKSTQIAPAYAPAWINFGNALTLLGQTARAEECFKRVLKIDATDLGALSGLAWAYRKSGRTAEAAKMERTVARYRENNPYYLLHVAREEFGKGNPEAARQLMKRAIRIKDDEPEFYDLIVDAARALGLQKEATRWAERARKLLSTSLRSEKDAGSLVDS